MPSYPLEPEKTDSLGFMRMEEDVPGMRSAGFQGWAGVLNTHFWLNPARDHAGLILSRSQSFVEPPFASLYERHERAVFSNLAAQGK